MTIFTTFLLRIVFLLILFNSSNADATVYVRRYPTDTAVLVAQTSDIPSGSATNVGVGTTGRHLVYTGSATAGPSSSVFENSSGNIGIGTITPGEKLDVRGNIQIGQVGGTSLSVYAYGAPNGNVGKFLVSGSNNAPVVSMYDTSQNQQVQIHGAGVSYFNGGNVGIGTNTPQGSFVVTNGNVGIGTWAPSSPFQINGASAMFARDTQFVFNFENTAQSTYTSALMNYGNAGFLFQPNGVEKSRFDIGGNLGIGTTLTTTAGLSVMRGNVGIGTWKPSANFSIESASSPTFSISPQTGIASQESTVNLYRTNGSGGQTQAGSIYTSAGNLGTIGLNMDASAQGSYSLILKSNSAGYILMNPAGGNVGIGTANPVSILTLPVGTTSTNGINFGGDINVYRHGAGTMSIESTNATPMWRVRSTAGRNLALSIGDASVPAYKLVADGGGTDQIFRIGTEHNGPLDFETNTAVRMFIDKGGNVGISSTNPGNLLDVFGSQRILNSGSLQVTGGTVSVGTTNASSPPLLWLYDSASAGTGAFIYSPVTTGFFPGVTVRNTGNTVNCIIYANGSSSVGNFFTSPTIANAKFSGMICDNGNNTVFGTENDTPVWLRNSTGSLVVNTGGNVGIGSAAPGAVLDVTGTIRLNGTGAGSFRVQAAANQSCATTCTTGKALMGFDQGTLGAVLGSIVGPSDATADQCLCGS